MNQLNEPANAAVMKQAMLALTTTRKKLSRISCRRSGQMDANRQRHRWHTGEAADGVRRTLPVTSTAPEAVVVVQQCGPIPYKET